MMNVTITIGGRAHKASMPQIPSVGDTIQLSLPDAPMAPAPVKHVNWQVGQNGKVDVDIECG
ncbi:MAG: hypothetical protein ACK4K7_13030 [Allosphingosinicella sp.]|uniref:hypothetical protein n=1 Tax=Allosphingosinicella sp. TaxID=2823234 RepID=UPI0039257EA5